jgi:hypothetical protein
VTDKIKVGYVPYSTDLSHPGDRRRIASWAKSTNNELFLNNPLESDLIVLSGSVNFDYWLKQAKKPVVLDLVDGYLGEDPNFLIDVGRNLIRSFKGNSNFSAVTFTKALRNACELASAVIVASPEQAEGVKDLNSNIHIILDDHSELDEARNMRNPSAVALSPRKYIFWEGFGYTIKHFEFLSKSLDDYIFKNNITFLILTNPEFARWGGYLGRIDSKKLIQQWFPLSKDLIEIIPWSIENVIRAASISEFAIIPVDTKDKFANLKPENKLLSMWHLGLPTIFSNTRAYQRIAEQTGVSSLCVEKEMWSETFANLEFLNLENSLNQSLKFIAENHTKEILAKKWQAVFDSVLDANG